MGTMYPLVTMSTHGRYLREGHPVRGHAGHQGEEDAAAELRGGGQADDADDVVVAVAVVVADDADVVV